MKIVVVGTGYVGLVTGACLAEVGCTAVCVDLDAAKIARLNQADVPIYEPGLNDIVRRSLGRGALTFTTELSDALPGADAVFIAVGTPGLPDGSADVSQVLAVARQIGRNVTDPIVVVTKSTVPVGTTERLRGEINSELAARNLELDIGLAFNPEFLKEGSAVGDFLRPDRIVVGVDSPRTRAVLASIFRPFVLNGHPIIYTDIASAEITKYAANAMLATRISFMNMIAEICENTGADVGAVRRGIGADPRIGAQFLYAGIGYGGSCFPKDVRALISSGESAGIDMSLLRSVELVNNRQRSRFVARLQRLVDPLSGARIAIWGMAFKPNTDDVREAPALDIIRELHALGADVVAYDPVATEAALAVAGDHFRTGPSAYDVLDGADALVLVTEWPEFRSPDIAAMKQRMRGRTILDGRNVLDHEALRAAGFVCEGIGLPRQHVN